MIDVTPVKGFQTIRELSTRSRLAVVLLLSATAVDAAPPVGAAAARPPAAIRSEVLREALSAVECARRHGVGARAVRLAIIDYTRPSLEPRLWVMDLDRGEVFLEEHVAHGRGSGLDVPTRFSDRHGSHQSSLGLFVTGSTYHGGNGYSLRLHGITKGLNESAAQRLIVMHGADYVNPSAAKAVGRLGRSWGCPVVRPEVARTVIDALKDGQLVYVHGPGTERLAQCRAEDLARAGVDTR